MTLKEKCMAANVNYINVLGYRKKHKYLTDEQIIEIYKQKKLKGKTFADKCREHDINYNTACKYKKNHPNLSDDDIIKYYTQIKEKTFTERCIENNIHTGTALGFRRAHKELSDEDIIKYYLNKQKQEQEVEKPKEILVKKKESLRYKCDKFNISYRAVVSYKHKHPELTEDEVLEIYKHKKSKDSARNGAFVGAILMGLISIPVNYFLTYPIYYNFMSKEAVLQAYQVIVPAVENIFQCLVLFNMPFTIVKGLLSVLITMLVYKHLSPILKGNR